MRYLNTLVLLFCAILSACGGGGGGGASSASGAASAASISIVTRMTQTNIVNTMAVGDVTGDGLDDVVVGGWNGNNTAYLYVFVQNTDGTLTDRTSTILPTNVYQGSQKVFIADLDGDGRKDIFLPGFDDNCTGGASCPANSVIFWNQSGQFLKQQMTERTMAHGACLDDIDSDGDLDMLVSGGYSGSVGGIYINNGSRSFTLNSSILPENSFDSCSIVHEPNGDISILLGDSWWTAEFKSNITVLDSNLTLKYHIGVNSVHSRDLVNSIAIDVNNDGLKDFVMMFNGQLPSDGGSKEVWLNTGAGYTYSYTINHGHHNQYYTHKFDYNGTPVVYFSGVNDKAQLFQLSAGSWISYQQSRFTTMAQSVGAHPGVLDWTVDAGVVYLNSSNNKIYMLQLLNKVFYTNEL
jgi:hypothetical protein